MSKVKIGLYCPPINSMLELFVRRLLIITSNTVLITIEHMFYPGSVRMFGFEKSANVFIAFENGLGVTGRKKCP